MALTGALLLASVGVSSASAQDGPQAIDAEVDVTGQQTGEITLDTVKNAVRVAEPLGLFDCSPVTDGAAAVLLVLVVVVGAPVVEEQEPADDMPAISLLVDGTTPPGSPTTSNAFLINPVNNSGTIRY